MKKDIIILILLLTIGCNNEENSPKEKPKFTPQSIEDVIAYKDYYVTFYLNGELWWDRNATTPSVYDYNLDMSFNNAGYSGPEEYGALSLIANRYPDEYSEVEKKYWGEQYLRIRVSKDCYGLDSNMTEIPYHLNDYSFTDGLPGTCINFHNGYYTKQFIDSISNSEFSKYTKYRTVLGFNIWVDGVKTYNNSNQLDPEGLSDVVWGRFSGKFVNQKQDTLNITEGRFRLKEGVFREGY